MDCGITRCYNYDKECFFKTVLVRKPDPKKGCSYFRNMKKKEKTQLDEEENKILRTRADKGQKQEKKVKTQLDEKENKILRTRADKGQKQEKKVKKRRKEENSLQEIM